MPRPVGNGLLVGRNIVPWQTQDKLATLKSGAGMDAFCTWLAARRKSTGAVAALCWTAWTVDWTSSFDFAAKKGTNVGMGGTLGPKGEGDGPMAPLLGDPVANDSITLKWRKI